MLKNRLVVETGKHLAAKFSGLVAAFAMDCASNSTISGSLAFSDKLRTLGHFPYDVFNHTGNIWAGIVGGFATSFVTGNIQAGTANLRGTQETASTSRMNKIGVAAGLVATAAACYGLEKLGGQVDMLDVVYPLGVGALSASVLQVELQPDPFDGLAEYLNQQPSTHAEPTTNTAPQPTPAPNANTNPNY
jgi:hypothetical protein